MKDLSILIPAANEMFLKQTIDDILTHIEADTEIIAVLDGQWAEPPIPQHERVNIIYVPKSIGQRAAQNLACRLARGKYVAKVDAHCAFDQGFDRKMIEFFKEVGDDVTAVPTMRNLHAFDWKCYQCGYKKYQGPTPLKCDKCESTKIKRKMVWKPRLGTRSTSYCFDAEPHFQYFESYKYREPYLTDKLKGYTETMSLQGSFFMSTRENYWKWELCDEKLGNWGNQGLEVACATWFNGGRCLVYHNTWYAHMFRTQGGDFGFPWDARGNDQQATKNRVKDKYWNRKELIKLVEKFWPVKGWTQENLDELKYNINHDT